MANAQNLVIVESPSKAKTIGKYLGADYMCTDVPIAVKKFAAEKTPWLKVKY